MSYQPPPGGYPGYPPQQPFGAPQQGYPPPQQGYAPPQQGYVPPQQGYVPPQQGYPPPQQGYPPPQQGYPPPQQGYAQYPPVQQGYPPAQQGYPPPQQGYPPPQQGYPPPPSHSPQPYGGQPYAGPPQQYPPTQSSYGAPPPANYGSPQYAQPTPPSLGYGPPQHISWDASADADALRKAMKGFGTDEKALIYILAHRDPLQMAAIRQAYNQRHRRSLEADVASETSGYLEEGLLALIRGPLQQDVYILHRAMSGPGTKETVLNDVLLSRSNADLAAVKRAYQASYGRSLETTVRGELSMKTERHFMMVLAGNRAEGSAPVIPQQIDQDVTELYKATEGKVGTDELLVCSILSSRNDAQIRAIAHAYESRFRRSLETVIKKEFSGHMEDALLYQLRAGTDRVMRDAVLLEDAMAGLGTKDELLVNRVVRCHWDKNHMQQVKAAYKQRFGKDLESRIRGETSGDCERLLLDCISG